MKITQVEMNKVNEDHASRERERGRERERERERDCRLIKV